VGSVLLIAQLMVVEFFCVPGCHESEAIDAYKSALESGKFGEENKNPPGASNVFVRYLDKEIIKSRTIEVPLKKGDLVVWNSNLPHNGGNNLLKKSLANASIYKITSIRWSLY